MKKLISTVLIFNGICSIVVVLWKLLEVLILGDTQPNIVDSLVGGILTISLYKNFQKWGEEK